MKTYRAVYESVKERADYLPPSLPWDVPKWVDALYCFASFAIVGILHAVTQILYMVIAFMLLHYLGLL